MVGDDSIPDTTPCFDGIVLSSANQPTCSAKCMEGYLMSGSANLIECPNSGGDVNPLLTCTELECSAYEFPDGVIGSSGSNGCVEGEALTAVTNNVCDLSCAPGYTPSNTHSPTLHCNIDGGTSWSNFSCTELTCNSLTLPLGIVAAGDDPSACANNQVSAHSSYNVVLRY